ncbi:MAG: hypothetical protein H7844_00160 [Nitrospirae bacterium YQR-1]
MKSGCINLSDKKRVLLKFISISFFWAFFIIFKIMIFGDLNIYAADNHTGKHYNDHQLKQLHDEFKKMPAYNYTYDKLQQKTRQSVSGNKVSLLHYLQYTPSERDEGDCGNCFVWGPTAVAEVALNVQNQIKDRLSIQYINSCKTGVCACCGGYPGDFVIFYNAAGKFIPWSATNGSYVDSTRQCDNNMCPSSSASCSSISTDTSYSLIDMYYTAIPTTQDALGANSNLAQNTYGLRSIAIENIKNALLQKKAVLFLYCFPDSSVWEKFDIFWLNDNETVAWNNDEHCGKLWTPTGDCHVTAITGFNDEDGKPENQYWTVLNSWGSSTIRPNGLFSISMNMNYNCSHYNSTYGYWNDAYKFYTLELLSDSPPTLPAQPVLISPVDYAYSKTPTYKWDSVSNATNYYLYVVDSANNIVINEVITPSDAGCELNASCEYTPSTSLAYWTRYAWYLAAYNNAGLSNWSSGLSFYLVQNTGG